MQVGVDEMSEKDRPLGSQCHPGRCLNDEPDRVGGERGSAKAANLNDSTSPPRKKEGYRERITARESQSESRGAGKTVSLTKKLKDHQPRAEVIPYNQ